MVLGPAKPSQSLDMNWLPATEASLCNTYRYSVHLKIASALWTGKVGGGALARWLQPT